MNNDDLEKKLHMLTSVLRRPDPTSAWKEEILARARQEASLTPMPRTLPPRWLMLGWAAAWMAILALNFSMTKDGTTNDWVNRTKMQSPPMSTPSHEELSALIAFEQRRNLELELP